MLCEPIGALRCHLREVKSGDKVHPLHDSAIEIGPSHLSQVIGSLPVARHPVNGLFWSLSSLQPHFGC
jgi:hypothetical protein